MQLLVVCRARITPIADLQDVRWKSGQLLRLWLHYYNYYLKQGLSSDRRLVSMPSKGSA